MHSEGNGWGTGGRVIPFPKPPVDAGRAIKTLSPKAAEAFLLDSVSSGSAVFVGTVERRGRRYQCYRIFNSGNKSSSTVIYQAIP